MCGRSESWLRYGCLHGKNGGAMTQLLVSILLQGLE